MRDGLRIMYMVMLGSAIAQAFQAGLTRLGVMLILIAAFVLADHIVTGKTR